MNPLRKQSTKPRVHFPRRKVPLALAAVGAAALAVPAVAPDAAEAEVKEFPQEVRHLNGFWANEHVPAYMCPRERPYLENKNYAPFGTTLPRGVSVNQEREPWPIGVSITRVATKGVHKGHYGDAYGNRKWALGTLSDQWSSATNWTGGDQWYQVVLHCTSNLAEAYEDTMGEAVRP